MAWKNITNGAEKEIRGAPDRAHAPTLALMKQVQYRSYLLLERALEPLGVSAVQFRILTTLKQRQRISSAELARLYDVRPQTMFKQVALLESRGFIRRDVSEANKRILELELSPLGESTLTECAAHAAAVEKSLFTDFTAGELGMYRELMTRMLTSARDRRRAKQLGSE